MLLLATGGVWATCASGQATRATAPLAHGAAPQTAPANEDVVVIGRAVPDAVIGDVPPQNQLSPADIAAYGVGTVSELLDQIAEQTQSDQGRDNSSGPVVLVDGKCISGVNEVGDLPTEAILRLDILPEEVALKYGYDAQRKVINIILRRRVRAKVANLRAGIATEGEGENESGDLIYTRIHGNDRINLALRAASAASLLESERGLTSSASAVDPTGMIGTDTAARTLKPATRSYSANASFVHQLGDKVNASLNAQAAYATSDALHGLSDAALLVPGTSPYAAATGAEMLDRFLSPVALGQRTTTASAHGGLTVNADLSTRWKLSPIAACDHSDSRTGTDRGYDTAALQAAIAAGTAEGDPYGVISPALLGPVQRDRATALTDSGSASLVAMGRLFKLPAGDMRTSARVGGDVSALSATSVGSGMSGASTTRRSDANGQVSLDLPLTSRRTGFLAGVRTLTANVNAGVTQVSGYGALGTLGYGANWTPRTGVTVIASVNEDRVAPTLQQLDAPTIANANLRLYDYLRGETATVTQIVGGNPALKADDRHVVKLGLALNPLRHSSLSVTANYINSRTRNAIGTLLGATAATQAASADRFTRDASGTLIAVDSRR